MGMRVKIEDVARRAGVSIATVSLALNGDERINANTRDRIEAIAREMNYQPNPNAKRLAMRKSRQIGLVVPDIENIYYAALAQHTLNELLSSDYALTISSSMNSRRMERRIIDDMIGNQVEGLLIAPVEKPNDDVGYFGDLRRAGIPWLFVTARYPNMRHPAVMCDLYGGMKGLLEALYVRGCSRIAVLSAYVKRRSNMELLAADRDIPLEELALAVRESMEDRGHSMTAMRIFAASSFASPSVISPGFSASKPSRIILNTFMSVNFHLTDTSLKSAISGYFVTSCMRG